MTDEPREPAKEKSPGATALRVGAVVLIAGLVIYGIWGSLTTEGGTAESVARQTALAERQGRAEGGEGEAIAQKQRKSPRNPLVKALEEGAPQKTARWNPPRPLRLVVRFQEQGGRSADEARQRAEDARRRFLEGGEDSFLLIRELSDPPTGIPRDLASQWAHLSPREASPVLPVEDGFVVFFGTPPEPEKR